MGRYLIGEQDIKKATTYLPLVKKVALAHFIAKLCVESQEVAIKDGESITVLPDIYQRSQIREMQFRMGVFVKEYLGREFDQVHRKNGEGKEEPVPYLMSADDVDRYANVETQIDRLKRTKEISDDCYEILNDYHAWLKILNQEISALLAVKNDFVGRFVQAMNKGTSPEQLNAILDQLKQAQAEAEAMQNAKSND